MIKRIGLVLFLLGIGINISVLLQSCNRDNSINPVFTPCEKARMHISECTLKTDEYLVYFPDWENYCKEETPEKFLNMTCEEILQEFFEDRR
jgi:hypothetical protein